MEILRQRYCRLIVARLAVVLLILAPATAFDAERDWANTGTDFNTSGSWSGNTTPGTGDVAWFKIAKSTDPSLSSSVSIAGFYFGSKGGTSSSGYDVTSSSTAIKFTLTAVASTTGGVETSNSSAAAIGADNTSGTNTIDASLVLAPASGSTSTFYQASGGTLVVNGDLSGPGTTLSLNTSSSSTPMFQLAGNSTYSGGTTLASGVVLNVNSSTAIGSGNLRFNGSATIDNTSNASITLTNNNSIALSGGSLTFVGTGDLSFGTGVITMSGANRIVSVTNSNSTLTIGGVGQDASTRNFTKSGAGTLIVTGTSTYTGTTFIGAGKLNAAADSSLGTGTITVSSSGSIVFTNSSATNRISNTTDIVLLGGTFARSGPGAVSEGSGASVVNGNVTGGTNVVGMGALTLNASSTLDFQNDGGRGTLVFSSFVPNGNVLNILNWISSNANRTTNTSGVDGADDRLIFGQDESASLARFNFGSGLTAAEIALGGGFFEIIAVPESETWVASALALVVICYQLSVRQLQKITIAKENVENGLLQFSPLHVTHHSLAKPCAKAGHWSLLPLSSRT